MRKHRTLRQLLALLALFTFPFRALAIDIGTPAPEFSIKTLSNKNFSLKDHKDKTIVLEWFNQGCPFVQKHYDAEHMQSLQEKFTTQGVIWLLVKSTNNTHRDFENIEKTKETLKKWNTKNSDLLLDQDGVLGKLYNAKTTPHMFIINNGTLVYQGAIDDNPDAYSDPKEDLNYVEQALNELSAGKKVATPKTKAYGCSVKY